MRYVLAEKQKAVSAGFLEVAHKCNEKYMILNENEIKYSSRLTGNLVERAQALGGELLSQAQTFLKIKRKGKYQIL